MHTKTYIPLFYFKQIVIPQLNKQFDNINHCKPCGITFHQTSFVKHNKSDKQFLIAGE